MRCLVQSLWSNWEETPRGAVCAAAMTQTLAGVRYAYLNSRLCFEA